MQDRALAAATPVSLKRETERSRASVESRSLEELEEAGDIGDRFARGVRGGHQPASFKVGLLRTRASAPLGAAAVNPPIQMIQPNAYNKHRSALALAGCSRAAKSHPSHGSSHVPDSHGQGLVDEAQLSEAEYRKQGNHAKANKLRVAIQQAKADFGFYSG